MIFIKERDRDSWPGRNSQAFFGVKKLFCIMKSFHINNGEKRGKFCRTPFFDTQRSILMVNGRCNMATIENGVLKWQYLIKNYLKC